MANTDIHPEKVRALGLALVETADRLTAPIGVLREIGSGPGAAGFTLENALSQVCTRSVESATGIRVALGESGRRTHLAARDAADTEATNTQIAGNQITGNPGSGPGRERPL